MKLVFSVLLSLACGLSLFAQAGPLSTDERASLAAAEADLLLLSYTMHTDSSNEARFTACKSLIKELVGALKTSNSFNYDFAALKGVNVITAPDNSFRFSPGSYTSIVTTTSITVQFSTIRVSSN